MDILERLRHRLDGPPPVLPAALDRCSEWWWTRSTRVRCVLVIVLVIGLLGCGELRIRSAQARWSGPPRRALVAVADGRIGNRPQVRALTLPPTLVPGDAPRSVPDDARLALALPSGAVLTRGHLSPDGPTAGLADDLRLVPVPVESGWDVRSGVRVDVWVVAAAPEVSRRVAQGRPVVAVTHDDRNDPSALVGLRTDEVGPVMQGLASGQVLLTQAPP